MCIDGPRQDRQPARSPPPAPPSRRRWTNRERDCWDSPPPRGDTSSHASRRVYGSNSFPTMILHDDDRRIQIKIASPGGVLVRVVPKPSPTRWHRQHRGAASLASRTVTVLNQRSWANPPIEQTPIKQTPQLRARWRTFRQATSKMAVGDLQKGHRAHMSCCQAEPLGCISEQRKTPWDPASCASCDTLVDPRCHSHSHKNKRQYTAV